MFEVVNAARDCITCPCNLRFLFQNVRKPSASRLFVSTIVHWRLHIMRTLLRHLIVRVAYALPKIYIGPCNLNHCLISPSDRTWTHITLERVQSTLHVINDFFFTRCHSLFGYFCSGRTYTMQGCFPRTQQPWSGRHVTSSHDIRLNKGHLIIFISISQIDTI